MGLIPLVSELAARSGQEVHLDEDDPDQPGIAPRLVDLIAGIGLLVSYATGWGYFCGATALGNGWAIDPDAFGAYAAADHLVLRQ